MFKFIAAVLSAVVEAFTAASETFGATKMFLFGVALAVGVFYGITNSNSDSDKAEMVSSIPDGVSSECYAQLLRRGLSETTVERAERQQSASKDCGSLGTVK